MIAFARGYERFLPGARGHKAQRSPIHPAALAVLLLSAGRPRGGRLGAFGPALRAGSVPEEPDPVLQRELDRALAGVRNGMGKAEYVRLRAAMAELFRVIDRLDLSDDHDDDHYDTWAPAWSQ